jgi:hypothetical protein
MAEVVFFEGGESGGAGSFTGEVLLLGAGGGSGAEATSSVAAGAGDNAGKREGERGEGKGRKGSRNGADIWSSFFSSASKVC